MAADNARPDPSKMVCDHLLDAIRLVADQGALRPTLNRLIELMRPVFIFDNFVVYRYTAADRTLEVAYAKSAGRGRSAGADVAWGEQLASQVLKQKHYIYQVPSESSENDRLKQAHILIFPVFGLNQPLGVFSLIRYGGPPFDSESIKLAGFINDLVHWLLERDQIAQKVKLLESEQKQVRLQEDFVNTISHELKNPLGFIKGYTTTLLRQDKSWDKETQKEFLHIIDQETDQLTELIENLLDSARLQSGQLAMDFHPLRLDALLKNVVQRFLLQHPRLEVTQKYIRNIPVISGDAKRLSQVFENLLGNAQKYAPGSRILIETVLGDDHLIIHVRDFGPGIPQKYLPFIFQRFFRVPEHALETHGTGLGLFICKQIIESHGGRITLQSVVGSGTTFSIQLPVAENQQQTEEEG